MKFIGNLLWLVFGGGLVAWFLWVLGGIILCCTIVGIPFGVAAFRIAKFALLPFGKELVDNRVMGGKRVCGTGFLNFLWVIVAGLWLAIAHACVGISYCCTIVGIPWGLAHLKLAKVSFAPLGKEVVTDSMAKLATGKAEERELEKRLGA